MDTETKTTDGHSVEKTPRVCWDGDRSRRGNRDICPSRALADTQWLPESTANPPVDKEH